LAFDPKPSEEALVETRFRSERDSLGSVLVSAEALFGAHTVRALGNFAVSGVSIRERPAFIAALGSIKAAAARANVACGVLDERLAEAITEAAREVARGEHDDQFPIEIVQGGGGTAVNMNCNEVVANRANELLGGARGTYDPVRPNDHVNRSQSTNDVYPTALALATVQTGRRALSGIAQLEQAFAAKAAEAGELERLGRTCLQDAVPITIAATHRGHAHALRRTSAALAQSLDELLAVPLGATAVGTGLGAPSGYRERVLELLAGECGLAVTGAGDLVDALANIDGYVTVAARVLSVALVCSKIASDLRLLSSGPVGGLGEVHLPAVQVGSSIMPGKVNPVMPELMMQVGYETRGMFAIVEAAAAGGELELNVMEPVITKHLLANLHDLGVACELFAVRCVAGLQWDTGRINANLAGSLAAAVEQLNRDGYAAAVASRSTGAEGGLG
jgi:aspartate ammonia-lyase